MKGSINLEDETQVLSGERNVLPGGKSGVKLNAVFLSTPVAFSSVSTVSLQPPISWLVAIN